MTKKTFFNNNSAASETVTKQVKFHSQPMPRGAAIKQQVNFSHNPSIRRLKDRRFDTFKTLPGKLEKQLSKLRGKPQEHGPDQEVPQNSDNEALPVDRYFDALEGPELDTLRVCVYLPCPSGQHKHFLSLPRSNMNFFIFHFIAFRGKCAAR